MEMGLGKLNLNSDPILSILYFFRVEKDSAIKSGVIGSADLVKYFLNSSFEKSNTF